MYAFVAINFPLRTTFASYHMFLYVVFLFSFVSRFFYYPFYFFDAFFVQVSINSDKLSLYNGEVNVPFPWKWTWLEDSLDEQNVVETVLHGFWGYVSKGHAGLPGVSLNTGCVCFLGHYERIPITMMLSLERPWGWGKEEKEKCARGGSPVPVLPVGIFLDQVPERKQKSFKITSWENSINNYWASHFLILSKIKDASCF